MSAFPKINATCLALFVGKKVRHDKAAENKQQISSHNEFVSGAVARNFLLHRGMTFCARVCSSFIAWYEVSAYL
jgi:hypothetical protein